MRSEAAQNRTRDHAHGSEMKTRRVDAARPPLDRVSARRYLVRNAFLNWDKDASGKLDYDEFRADSALNFGTTASSRSHGTATQATPCGS